MYWWLYMNFLVFTVMKFKQRPRFLEFFTQVMQKCMHDEKFQLMVEITNPIYDFLKRYCNICFISINNFKKWVKLFLKDIWCDCELVALLCLTLWDPLDCSPPTPPFIEFSRQEYWSRLPFPSPRNLPDPGMEPGSILDPGRFFTIWATREALKFYKVDEKETGVCAVKTGIYKVVSICVWVNK